MSILKTSLTTACIASLVTAGCLYALHRSAAREAAALQRENTRLRQAAIERHRAAPTPSPVPAPPSPGVAVPAGSRAAVPEESQPLSAPAPNYRNEGQATARAALQTFAWACDQGDAAAVARLITFDDAARAKAIVWFDSMAPASRPKGATVEAMAASVLTLAGMALPFPSSDILEHVPLEEISESRARLRLPGLARNGTEFQRTSEGWKYAITESMVDDYVARTARARQPPQEPVTTSEPR